MSSRLQAVRAAAARFAFHRDQHHGWRRAAAWLLVCNVLTAAAFTGYVYFHSTVYIAVAATPDGRLVPLTPLDEPIMSDAALRNWTVATVTEAFTLGHHDWRLRLSAIREYFSDAGLRNPSSRASTKASSSTACATTSRSLLPWPAARR